MAYTQKDVTSKIEKKTKPYATTEEIMKEVDDSFPKIDGKKDEEVSKEESSLKEQEMDNVFAEEFHSSKKKSVKEEKPKTGKQESPKKKSSFLLDLLLSITVLSSLGYFIYHIVYYQSDVIRLVSSAILTLFAIVFLCSGFSSDRKKASYGFGSLLLLCYFGVSLFSTQEAYSPPSNKVQDFSGKSLVDVVKWGKKNNIKITQQYEYSDMVPEYEIISQNIDAGSSIKDLEEIVVAVSEGPSPTKEIIVPSMLTWDSERVINFVLQNYLNHVVVEYVDSDQVKDTVIEQSKSGNLSRDDELKLTFSFGEEGVDPECNLPDFTDMTQFEIEFFMKQHKLNYEIERDFSSKIKKGNGTKQSIDPGSVVKPDSEKIIVTISKGPKIVIPDFSGMSITEITEWAIENRLKLEFDDIYDDTVKKGDVISVDKNKGDVVEQGTLLKVKVSLGKLKMPKFDNIDAFYAWADKYSVKYEIRHEFSDTVKAGGIIDFSYKAGDVLKNDDAITVTISDGSKVTVPNLKGLTKSEAIKKLKNAGLNYNFIYRNSSNKKDTVLAQSLKSGSEVSEGTTVTVTLSNGNSGSSSSGSSGHSGNSGNQGGGSSTPTPPSPPAPTCYQCTILRSMISSSVAGFSSCSAAANNLRSVIQSHCQGLNVSVSCQRRDGYSSMDFVGSSPVNLPGSINTCETPSLSIILAE